MSGLCFAKVAALGVLLVAGLGLIVACNKGEGGDPLAGSTGMTQEDATATAEAEQRQMMGELLNRVPNKDYTSFEEAEQVAGFHIPRPSPDYPVAYGLTHLQWFEGLERPQSRTIYWFTPPDWGMGRPGVGIGVDVAPAYYSPDGYPTSIDGRATAVGGKSVWLIEEEFAWVFIFDCGSVDDVKVWCQVTGPKDIGWDALDHFVSTLQ